MAYGLTGLLAAEDEGGAGRQIKHEAGVSFVKLGTVRDGGVHIAEAVVDRVVAVEDYPVITGLAIDGVI